MNGWQDPPQFLGSHFSGMKTTTLLSFRFLNQPEKENLNLKDRGQGGVTSPGQGSVSHDAVGSQGGNDAAHPVFPGGGRAGGTGWNPLPQRIFHSNSVAFFLSFKIQEGRVGGWGAGCCCSREEHGAHPSLAALASPPASFPASPGPLSGSRAAAHMVPCQIPGGSGGHVSGSLQLRRPRVTMETAANGKPELPAGAEPSAAGAGGAGAGRGRSGGGAEETAKCGRGPGHTRRTRAGRSAQDAHPGYL